MESVGGETLSHSVVLPWMRVCVCVLNFIALVSYGVDLVAEQQWGLALEWTVPKEE